MAVPHLPLDVLAEIFTHFHASSPSYLFDPVDGLLNDEGRVGTERRRWVRELTLAQGAAVPYDVDKSRKVATSVQGFLNTGHQLHVDLRGATLPDLRGLTFEPPSYLTPQSRKTEESYRNLIDQMSEEEGREWQKHERWLPWKTAEFAEWWVAKNGIERTLATRFDGLFDFLAQRNNDIIGALLSTCLAGNEVLKSVHLPFAPMVDDVYPGPAPIDTRITDSLFRNKHLVITLHPSHDDRNGYWDRPKTRILKIAHELATQIGDSHEVRVLRLGKDDRDWVLETLGRKKAEKVSMFARWSFVEDDGSLTPWVPSV